MTTNIYNGIRGQAFKSMISNILSRGRIKPKYIDVLTSVESLKQYDQAFTSSYLDKKNNYERFEQIGDVTANKFLIWYIYRRFPQLDCTEGVKVAARIKINYGSRAMFAPVADKLGLWPYISALTEGTERNVYYRNTNKKDLLEDVFESFIGCTEYLLDKNFRIGVGYAIVYDILKSIYDEIDISLRYEDLYDAKTRIKETFDMYKDLGSWQFIEVREKEENKEFGITKSYVYQVPLGNPNTRPIRVKTGNKPDEVVYQPQPGWVLLGTGTASRKNDAQQHAASQALINLKRKGWYKSPPSEYEYFCNST
jgi:dsRNA-specific ribonuclease